MIQTAWEWAEKRGKKRKNPVHGEEEICFVLDDEFLLREERGQSLSASGSFEMEDRYCTRRRMNIPAYDHPTTWYAYMYEFDMVGVELCRILTLTCWMALLCQKLPSMLMTLLILLLTKCVDMKTGTRMKQHALARLLSSFLMIYKLRSIRFPSTCP